MSANFTCIRPDWFWPVFEKLDIFAYGVLGPLRPLIACSILGILIVSLRKHVKSDHGFTFLLYLIGVDIAETVAATLFVFSFHWCSETFSGQSWWCMRQYWIIFYGFRLSLAITQGLTTVKLFVCVAVAADRFAALWRPLWYRNRWPHVRYQRITFAASVVIGFGTSVFDCFRFRIIYDSDSKLYNYATDIDYLGSTTAQFLSNLRNGVRLVGLIALIALNTAVVRLFRSKVNQVDTMAATSNAIDEAREKRKKENERALFALAISQSVLSAIETIISWVYFAVRYVSPEFADCTGLILSPIIDAAFPFTTISNLLVLIFLSKPLRQMMSKTIRCK